MKQTEQVLVRATHGNGLIPADYTSPKSNLVTVTVVTVSTHQRISDGGMGPFKINLFEIKSVVRHDKYEKYI